MTSSVVHQPLAADEIDDVPTVLQSPLTPVTPAVSPDSDKPDTPPATCRVGISHVAVQPDDDGDMCVFFCSFTCYCY